MIITFGRMRTFISFEEDDCRYTDSNIAAKALSLYPLLSVHSCINSKGPTFGTVIDSTSIAHLIEHLMIAEQSKLAADKGFTDVTFVGMTQWIDERAGLAEVQVSFIDDLDAVHALSKAMEAVEGFVE